MNLILQHSDKVQVKDIEEEALTKLYTMSLKSQMAAVRILAVENLQIDLNNLFSNTTFRNEKMKKMKKFYNC